MGECRAVMAVINQSDEDISNVKLWHRYDDDAHDYGSYSIMHDGKSGHEGVHALDNFGATFWVTDWLHPFRTGADYWKIEFEAGDFRYFLDHDIKFELHLGSDKGRVSLVVMKNDDEFYAYVIKGEDILQMPFTPTRLQRDERPRIRNEKARENARAWAARRPFYVIAHECNSPEKCRDALEQGANAIELDVTYNSLRGEWTVRHWGVASLLIDPDAVDGSSIEQVLPYLNKVAHDEKYLCVIIFDIKSPFIDKNRFDKLYHNIKKYLTDVSEVLSVFNIEEAGLLLQSCHDIRDSDGFFSGQGYRRNGDRRSVRETQKAAIVAWLWNYIQLVCTGRLSLDACQSGLNQG